MPLYQPPNVNAPVLSQFSLKGKIAAVTGGARGIGVEIVRGLAEAGADVALIYASSADANETAAKIAADTRVRVKAFQSDVASRNTIAATINQIAEEFGHGRLDIVVANAGVCANVPSLEYTEESWQRNNSVNLDGVMWTAQAAGKIFKNQGKGNLIITASASAILVNIPQTQAAYNASKAAAVHLAKCLAVEWMDFARVNCISPGYMLTEMLTNQPKELMSHWLSLIPGRRICDAAELKGAYVFLASDACCYMTGANIVIDDGYTLP
ncbi:putative short chain dehydrogenase reductase family [Lipomyces tetrasporus]|uniref:Short chain dehydrogenase reductase family n=1 Tax=Lipomyces tetrasporus TaxID=54092 RepID=A0AAD7QJV7_9ASCO|nr:putative short chain dehydrogenase reductase family [Lipomyces tetrasporus]KAJ8096552.1 putative short chain dehydrogenase reductase family [Lipomyces tetrasporus]